MSLKDFMKAVVTLFAILAVAGNKQVVMHGALFPYHYVTNYLASSVVLGLGVKQGLTAVLLGATATITFWVVVCYVAYKTAKD